MGSDNIPSSNTFVITENNIKLIEKACEEQALKALEACGMEAENYAKISLTQSDAVDTGFLRNSVTYCLAGKAPHIQSYSTDAGSKVKKTGSYGGTQGEVGELAVYVGTNLPYASSVELGTGTHSNKGPRPFLKPAIADHLDHYNRIIEKILSR